MNWDYVKGNWSQLTGSIKSEWGKLTDNEIRAAAGEWDQMVGLLKERYGLMKEDAEKELDAFVARQKAA